MRPGGRRIVIVAELIFASDTAGTDATLRRRGQKLLGSSLKRRAKPTRCFSLPKLLLPSTVSSE